jgi:hypothetical protein
LARNKCDYSVCKVLEAFLSSEVFVVRVNGGVKWSCGDLENSGPVELLLFRSRFHVSFVDHLRLCPVQKLRLGSASGHVWIGNPW